MYYAGAHPNQKVLPVPIFQAAEDFTIFCILLLVERWLRTRTPAVASDGSPIPPAAAPLPPAGIVSGSAWCCGASSGTSTSTSGWVRTAHLGSILVQLAGVALAIAGIVLLATRVGPYRRWRDTRPDPAAAGRRRRTGPAADADRPDDRRTRSTGTASQAGDGRPRCVRGSADGD